MCQKYFFYTKHTVHMKNEHDIVWRPTLFPYKGSSHDLKLYYNIYSQSLKLASDE